MKVRASAPGKAILFGEHAVVYGKPAIAVAVNRRAVVTIREGTDDNINIVIPELDVYGTINIDNQQISPRKDSNFDIFNESSNLSGESKIANESSKLSDESKSSYDAGILKYIQKALFNNEFKPDQGLDIQVDLEIPIGAGLGSSAAVTVATLAAAARYHQQDLTREKLAKMAHQVELEVQGAASPLDTTISTYGGFIYFTHKEGAVKLKTSLEMPLVVGYTSKPGNTGELIVKVRKLCEKYPDIINPIMDTIENVTNQARESIINGEEKSMGELMNINQGLLDALGVNTPKLSNIIYQARSAGAIGSKITGAGGGGSIIAYCPGKSQEVLGKLQSVENAFQVSISSKGVTW